jgi:arsenite methyltransferase
MLSAGRVPEDEDRMTSATVDRAALEAKVKDMYRQVAVHPGREYHFELGRSLAERLGYPAGILDRIPADAIESFAGVGYFFHLAELRPGQSVIDLGSGSGTDVFFAATQVGPEGRVVGVDFSPEQRAKAEHLAAAHGYGQVELVDGRIDKLPANVAEFDCAISNGVINLSPDKPRVFAEVARVLRPGGRLAIADIVSEQQLTESIVCNADLWASCIGGAEQQDAYVGALEAAGLHVETIRQNRYQFMTSRARNASDKYGVKSISLRATKV